MVTIPFLKKIQFPKLNFRFSFGPASFVGIDIGSDSVKVVQLRKDRERAVLETYGELKSAPYLQKRSSQGIGGFLGYKDEDLVDLLTDVLRESNATTKRAVFSIPSTSSFIIAIQLPAMAPNELASAIPFEAKKYIPIPVQEVALDWQILEEDATEKRVLALLAAVPHEVVAKYQRIADALQLDLEAVEIESFSLVRSLAATERAVVAIINWGALVTTVTIVDQRRIRMNHNFGHGSREVTTILAQSLSVSPERAEAMKREVGLSEKPEERETVSIIGPIVDSTLSDVERAIVTYNRRSKRKVEKIILTGGGASLAGLVNHVARRFGLETVIGNPFHRTVFPEFLQPLLKEIAPNFGVAVGLALRPITPS
ncbi:MAG: type IV pilus assembly protein PilM [Candidatus Sungbacteria bacterium]|uniref:Type IV pilus assembly protein PilM n=1 Tax=Candidatus Sungiibacteriota bacterium TaxID=2750080 RepID=A0A932YYY1_9BACT|nr:type IV pilus assembly protein PilM [Candidatus Sungbacteria bacterium]